MHIDESILAAQTIPLAKPGIIDWTFAARIGGMLLVAAALAAIPTLPKTTAAFQAAMFATQ